MRTPGPVKKDDRALRGAERVLEMDAFPLDEDLRHDDELPYREHFWVWALLNVQVEIGMFPFGISPKYPFSVYPISRSGFVAIHNYLEPQRGVLIRISAEPSKGALE
jgi:hypothetical protein